MTIRAFLLSLGCLLVLAASAIAQRCNPSNPQVCTIAPAQLEINLGPFPVDKYSELNQRPDRPGFAIIKSPRCTMSMTVQECVRVMFNNNPALQPYHPENYLGQGVRGVRFFFALGGQFYSTPFILNPDKSYQSINPAWRNNLVALFTDLRVYGIEKVTPTPGLSGWAVRCNGEAPYIGCDCGTNCIEWSPRTPKQICGRDEEGGQGIFFVKTSPFPYNGFTGYPVGREVNDAYNCADANPDPSVPELQVGKFWGWRPFLDALDTVLEAAQTAGLRIEDFDLQNELNVTQFTVAARLIYDNKHDINGDTGIDPVTGLPRVTNVFAEVRARMAARNFDSSRLTFSVQPWQPSRCGFDCGSVYGDSAMLIHLSELTAALAGGYFGYPSGTTSGYHLPCGGNLDGMIYLPDHYSYTQPTVMNIHNYVLTYGQDYTLQQASACTAWTFYNSLWNFMSYRQRTSDYVVFGESFNTLQPPPDCGAPLLDWTYASVRGFMASSLERRPTPNAGTVFRVWNDIMDAPPSGRPLDYVCHTLPNIINPPYKP